MPVDLIVVLLIALVIVLIVRGPKTLPKWGETLGKGVKEARAEASKAQAEIQARAGGDTTTTATTATTATTPPATGDGDHPADRPA